MEPVITVDRFEEAREKSDDIWDDYEVFDEERDRAPLREVVLEVVEGQYTHPAGPDSVYGMEGSAEEIAREKVTYEGLVPDGIPTDVQEKFADEFAEAVRKNASELYKDVRGRVDPEENASLSEVREVLEARADELVSDEF